MTKYKVSLPYGWDFEASKEGIVRVLRKYEGERKPTIKFLHENNLYIELEDGETLPRLLSVGIGRVNRLLEIRFIKKV